MYWTLELAHHLEEGPWPATRDELIDYAIRSGDGRRGRDLRKHGRYLA